jgi:ABC-type sugar transport system permease subunit
MFKGFKLSKLQRYQWAGLLFVLPVVIGTFLLDVLPAVGSLALSFSDWDLLKPPPEFIGLQNYGELFFRDSWAKTAFLNTLKFALGSITLGTTVSLILALLVNERLFGIQFFRLAFYLPVVSSAVATALVWQWVLNSKVGLVNTALGWVGVQGPAWLTDPRIKLFTIILVSVWGGAGYNMMLFLAGLQNIPQELYDAAKIDGAGSWRRFVYVTLPMLSPTTFFVLIMSFIGSFQVFALVFMLTGGGSAAGRGRDPATDVWVYYLWRNGFSFWRMGYASAMAWVLFAVIGVVTFVQWKLQKRWVHYA